MQKTIKILLIPLIIGLFLSAILFTSAQIADTSVISLSGTDWTLKVDSQLQTVTDSKSTPYVSTTAKGEKELFLTLNSLEDCKLGYIQFKVATTGLTVYKQLPLNEELAIKEGVYDFVNATHAMLKDVTKVYRPENVVNSFACFDSTGKKVLHIYASQLIDNAGNSVWVDSDLQDGLLTVYLDAKFLDTAKFPVVLDPTFGYTSIGSSETNINNDHIFANVYACNETAKLYSILAYIKAEAGTVNVETGLYNTSSGVTLTDLLGTSDAVQISSTYSWVEFIMNNEDLSAKNYGLAINPASVIYAKYDSGSGLTDNYQVRTGQSNWIDPFGTPDFKTTNSLSIYANYTVETEPTPTPTPTATPTPTPEPTETPEPTTTPTEFTSTETWNIIMLLSLLVIGLIIAVKSRIPILNFVLGGFMIGIAAWTLTVAPYFGGLLQLAVIIIGIIVMVSGYKEVY